MDYYSNPMSFGLNNFDVNSFMQPQQTQTQPLPQSQPQTQFYPSPSFMYPSQSSIPVPHPTQLQSQPMPPPIKITQQLPEIQRLNAEIQQLKKSKKEQDALHERVISNNQEIIKMFQALFAEKQEIQSKFEEERTRLNACIIDLQSEIGILENKLSGMQGKEIDELEKQNHTLKKEKEYLKSENERLAKSNAFWIIKIHWFLLNNSSMKTKYGGEIRHMQEIIKDDYVKTGIVVARTKEIIKEYFDMKQK